MILHVTEVSVSIPEFKPNPYIRAYANLVLEYAFVVRGIRVVVLPSGKTIVQMPSRRTTQVCEACSANVERGGNYCGHCGVRLGAPPDDNKSGWGDLAYPINAEQRREIDVAVLRAYDAKSAEVVKAAGVMTTAGKGV